MRRGYTPDLTAFRRANSQHLVLVGRFYAVAGRVEAEFGDMITIIGKTLPYSVERQGGCRMLFRRT